MALSGQGGWPAEGRSRLDDHGYIMVVLLIGMAVTAVWMAALLPTWQHNAIREKEEDLVFRMAQYGEAVQLYRAKNNCTLPTSLDALVSGHFLRKKWNDPITGKEFDVVAGAGGIAGVISKSQAASIKIIGNAQQYNLWQINFGNYWQFMDLSAPAPVPCGGGGVGGGGIGRGGGGRNGDDGRGGGGRGGDGGRGGGGRGGGGRGDGGRGGGGPIRPGGGGPGGGVPPGARPGGGGGGGRG